MSSFVLWIDTMTIGLHLSEIYLFMQITFPPMSLAPQIHFKTMIAISTPHVSTFPPRVETPHWTGQIEETG